jgi:hypothetical protein
MGTSTSVCGGSSERFKENIQPITYGLSDVLKLNPVFFNWKQEYMPGESDKRQVGLIAEEVAGVLPELVGLDSQGLPVNVDYPKVSAVLIKAIQELNIKLDSLTNANATNTSANNAELSQDSPFISQISHYVIAFFENLGVKITQGIVELKNLVADVIFAKEIHTEKLCVDDVCVDKEQLKALLLQAGGKSNPEGQANGAGVQPVTGNAEPVVEPEPEPSPQPSPGGAPAAAGAGEVGAGGVITPPTETPAESAPAVEPVPAPVPETPPEIVPEQPQN